MSGVPETEVRRYQLAAVLGVVLMGIGSFLSCLATVPAWSTAGTVLLLVSIGVMIWAFTHWEP